MLLTMFLKMLCQALKNRHNICVGCIGCIKATNLSTPYTHTGLMSRLTFPQICSSFTALH